MTRIGARQQVLARQIAWANGAGVSHDRGYTREPEANLFLPMSRQTLTEFRKGNGGELGSGDGEIPPKICALHSSSALAYNFFGYWRGRQLASLTRALGISATPESMEFEVQFATGMRGPPCNLDVVLWGPGDSLVAIESKFTEPFTPKRKGWSLSASYLPEGRPSPWARSGLHACDRLARSLQHQPFRYLDAAQLLKHVLGLHRAVQSRFSLLYLYYDVAGNEGRAHREEVDRFRSTLAGEVRCLSLSYQALLERFSKSLGSEHAEYLSYLIRRYSGLGGSE